MMEKNILITYPLSLGVSGGGTVGCIEIAKHLAQLGASVEILSVQSEAARGGFSRTPLAWEYGRKEKEQLHRSGIPVHTVSPHPLHYSMDGTRLRKVIDQQRAERSITAVISWHHELFGNYHYLQRLGIRTGIVTAAPSYQEFPGKSAITRRLRKEIIHSCLRQSDRIFTPSRYIAGSVLETKGIEEEKVIHAPWGVADRFRDTRPNPSLTGTFRIMFFGWWMHAKGFFDLIAALSPLRGQDWTLDIAGWGSEADVHQAAERSGIKDQIRVLGKLDHDELIARLERVNLVVLPSYVESFGLAVAEAQACGCPVIAYSVGAVPETVVDGETGWLVPRGDIPALTNRISEALANPAAALSRGLKGRERIPKQFSWQKTAGVILQEIG